MKIKAIAIGLGMVGFSATAYATPYYVGANLQPQNNITLGIHDTPTKELATDAGRGNIIALELKSDYRVMDRLAVGGNLPFYMANSKAVPGTDSRSALGNFALTGIWMDTVSSPADDMNWGYALGLDVYLPTSRKDEGGVVAFANPTTDLYRYHTKATTGHANAGLWAGTEMFTVKANMGYGFMHINDNPANTSSTRNTFTMQGAATWHALPNLAANLEYNSIILDSDTAGVDAQNEGLAKFRHAITPSISGNFNRVLAAAYASIPLDTPTRDRQSFSFGANVGYMF